MNNGLMNACVIVGGDPTYGEWVGTFNFRVPRGILNDLKALFPRLNRFCAPTAFCKLPSLACGLCGKLLPSSEHLDEFLAMTHIHSSLRLETAEFFLLDRTCAMVIKEFFEKEEYVDPVF